MSRWTHVVGVVRYDDLLRDPIQALKEIKRIEQFVKKDAPAGSEGGMHFTFTNRHEYSQDGNSTMYGAHLCELTFTGDLRDYGEEHWGELEDYFNRITKSDDLDVRQAVMVLNDDGFPKSKNKVYLYEESEDEL